MSLINHGLIHVSRRTIIGGLVLTVAVILTGCQSNSASKNNSSKTASSHYSKVATKTSASTKNNSSSASKSDVATDVLKNYTAKVPEDSSTRSNNGEITYSQFYSKGGSWNWQLTSQKRGVIADGRVLSASKGSDSSVLQMKSSGGTNYSLTLEPGKDGYSLKTDYQQISGSYTTNPNSSSSSATASSHWTTGVPSGLVGTWSTDYYPSSAGDAGGDKKVKTKRTRFFIDSNQLDFNTIYASQKHTIVVEGPGAGSLRTVQYKKLASDQYLLRDASGSPSYKVTQTGNQLKVSGYSTMKKISDKAGLSEGFSDGRAKNLSVSQVQLWISRHVSDVTGQNYSHGIICDSGEKDKHGELVVQAREHRPDGPVDPSIGFFKIDKNGVLQFSEDNGSDASWNPVSDDPND